MGLKSKWLDERALLNLDVFRSDYSDLQVSSLVPSPTGVNAFEVRNAASSRSQGVELEGQLAVTKAFRLAANVSYVDSHYLKYPNASGNLFPPISGPSQDLSGRPTLYAPKWSGSVTGTYTAVLPAGYRFSVEVIPYFSSSYYLHETDEPEFQQLGYVRLDARLGLETPDSRWGVDVIGKNLTDRTIISSFGSPYTAAKEETRNVALQLRYQF